MPTIEEILRMPAFAGLTNEQVIALSSVLNQFNSKINELNGVKAELEQAKANINTLTQEKEQLNATITERDGQITTLNETINTNKTEFEAKMTQMYFDNELAKAYQNIKLVSTMPESVVEAMKATALAQLKATGSPKLVDVNGSSVLKMVDSKGAVVMVDGKEATVEDMLKQTTLKDIIDTKASGGAGTGTPQVNRQTTGTLTSSAKNQIEADDIIKAHLKAQGLNVLDPQYFVEFNKLREDNKVSELPLK